MCAGSETHAVGTKVFVKDASGAWVRGVVTGLAGTQLVVQDDSGQQLECAPAAAPLQNVQQDAVEVGTQPERSSSKCLGLYGACVAHCRCICCVIHSSSSAGTKLPGGWRGKASPPFFALYAVHLH
jgi:hypothetical protein